MPSSPSSPRHPRRSLTASSAASRRCATSATPPSPPRKSSPAARSTSPEPRRCASAIFITPSPTTRSAPSSLRAAATAPTYLLDSLDLDPSPSAPSPSSPQRPHRPAACAPRPVELPAFHGPMLAADFSLRQRRPSAQLLQAALTGQPYSSAPPKACALSIPAVHARHPLRRLPQHPGLPAGHALGAAH